MRISIAVLLLILAGCGSSSDEDAASDQLYYVLVSRTQAQSYSLISEMGRINGAQEQIDSTGELPSWITSIRDTNEQMVSRIEFLLDSLNNMPAQGVMEIQSMTIRLLEHQLAFNRTTGRQFTEAVISGNAAADNKELFIQRDSAIAELQKQYSSWMLWVEKQKAD